MEFYNGICANGTCGLLEVFNIDIFSSATKRLSITTF